jgi:PadR family transcriptional regulator PadR
MKSASNDSAASLGQFEIYCLRAVVKLDDDAYGANVHSLLEETLRRPIPHSQVYICLSRLESKGFVRSVIGAPEPIRGGRRKRLFSIEALGTKVLRDATRTYGELSAIRIPSRVGS